jgi:predicted DNA-binding transcriptional regulator AlpA
MTTAAEIREWERDALEQAFVRMRRSNEFSSLVIVCLEQLRLNVESLDIKVENMQRRIDSVESVPVPAPISQLPAEDALLTSRELSELLGIPQPTLRRWILQRRGPPPRRGLPLLNRRVEYEWWEVRNWLLSESPKFACSKRDRGELLRIRILAAQIEVQGAREALRKLSLEIKERSNAVQGHRVAASVGHAGSAGS